MYKVGDRVLCKKNYKHNEHFFKCEYLSGNYYTIRSVLSSTISIWFDETENIWFNLTTIGINHGYFNNHFYTLSFVRKIKLERLNGI